jgi:hypothetical protein
MYATSYEKMKETEGSVATYVWIGSGLFLFLSDGGIGALFSLKAILFFVVGMFLAAIVFGNIGYLLQRGLGKVLAKFVQPSNSAAAVIGTLGVGLMLLNVTIVFLGARFVYNLL